MKIEFGDIKMKVPYEKFMPQKFTHLENPFETMFSKRNQDFYNNLFKRAQSSFANYFEESIKLMEKFSEMSKSDKNE